MTIEETINTKIEELIGKLADADAAESARIHTRIIELKSLKKDTTT